MVGRSYLHELGGPETAAGRCAEGATLAALALSDAGGLGQVLMADAKMALLALGAACTTLAAPEGATVFRRQLRACAHLGEKVTPKWDQRARFDFHTLSVAADEYLIPKTSAAEALAVAPGEPGVGRPMGMRRPRSAGPGRPPDP